jgi:hypothetical protein
VGGYVVELELYVRCVRRTPPLTHRGYNLRGATGMHGTPPVLAQLLSTCMHPNKGVLDSTSKVCYLHSVNQVCLSDLLRRLAIDLGISQCLLTGAVSLRFYTESKQSASQTLSLMTRRGPQAKRVVVWFHSTRVPRHQFAPLSSPRPREFSIASAHPHEVHLCVAMTTTKVKLKACTTGRSIHAGHGN